jgi:cytochrome c-type biogenesis protein CcmE
LGLLKRKKFIIGAIIVFAAIGILSIRAFAGSATYYYEVGELLSQQGSVRSDSVKVRGVVVEGSVVRQTEGARLSFTLADDARANSLPVTYQGVVPDTFKEGSEVVCEGNWGADGVFRATVLMPKCPSRYTPAAS